jgi:hypothetical protein
MNEELLHKYNQHQIQKWDFYIQILLFIKIFFLVNSNGFKNNDERNTIDY